MKFKSMDYLWIVLSIVCSTLSSDVVQVKLGDPVTLPCEKTQKVNYPCKVKWRTADQMVAQYSAGTFKAGSGFEGRVHLPENGKLKQGNYSLIISSTVYSDYDTYECWCNDEHLNSWTLQITTSSAETNVMIGDAATLPCYSRINRKAQDSDIKLLWTKGNERVLELKEGTVKTYGNFKRKATITPSEIRKGNISLHISETRFSDNGIYTCQIDNEIQKVTLHFTACHRTIHASLDQAVLINLHTNEDVNVIFRNSQIQQQIICDKPCDTMDWTKRNDVIELDKVGKEHVGTYTIIHRRTNNTICTYVMLSPEQVRSGNTMNIKSVFIALVLCACVFFMYQKCIFIM